MWCRSNDIGPKTLFFGHWKMDTVRQKFGHWTCQKTGRAVMVQYMKFTRENAAEMARRSHSPNSARHLQPETVALAVATAAKTADEQRRDTLAKQIDLLDRLIAKANGGERVLRLINAKAKLWELLYPKPGSLKPGKQRAAERAPISPLIPQPLEPKPALVVQPSDQNHNGESVQSQVAA